MKKIVLLVALVLCGCSSQEADEQLMTGRSFKYAKVYSSLTTHVYIMQLDSTEYIMVKNGDGVGLCKHR